MKKISIEIVEDESHPEGGHAIIRLKGLKQRPDNDAFMIEPADKSLAGQDLKGWPTGARTPLNARMTKDGFEIVAGPDVVESPVLLPGTPVVVKVPAAAVSTEVLWPSITPLRRQKIKRIMTTSDRRDAIARAQAGAAASAAGLSNGTGSRSDDALATPDAAKTGAKQDGSGKGAGSPGSMFAAGSSAAKAGAGAAGMAAATGSLAAAGGTAGGSHAAPPQDGSRLDAAQVKVDEPAVTIATPLDQLTEDKIRGREIVPVGRVETHQVREQGTRRYATLALAVALLAAATSVLSHFVNFGGSGGAAVVPAGSAPIVLVAAKPPSPLYDALSVGAISPQGIDASAVDPAAAIRQADESLYGGKGKRDPKEGAFWLKQYITKKFGNKQTLWALTQLGSTFAQPVGVDPDYQKARLLWETASALGDPIAACFLGGLHEYGLGVAASKYEALKWYLRAKESGGCRSVDQAIKRVRE